MLVTDGSSLKQALINQCASPAPETGAGNSQAELFFWGETPRVWFKGARSSQGAEGSEGLLPLLTPTPKSPHNPKNEPQRSIKWDHLGKEHGFYPKSISQAEGNFLKRLPGLVRVCPGSRLLLLWPQPRFWGCPGGAACPPNPPSAAFCPLPASPTQQTKPCRPREGRKRSTRR